MDHPGFWAPAGPFSLSKLASYAGTEIPQISTAEAGRSIRSVKALDVAGGSDVSFLDNRKYLAALKQTNWVIDGPRGAAKVLGLHPNTLRSRLKKLGITRSSHEPS